MKSLYIVDGHSHIFRAYHAIGYLSTSKGVPSHAVLILSTMLWKLIREEQPDYLGIALDPPGPTFRDALETQCVLDAILDSAKAGKWVDVAK